MRLQNRMRHPSNQPHERNHEVLWLSSQREDDSFQPFQDWYSLVNKMVKNGDNRTFFGAEVLQFEALC